MMKRIDGIYIGFGNHIMLAIGHNIILLVTPLRTYYFLSRFISKYMWGLYESVK